MGLIISENKVSLVEPAIQLRQGYLVAFPTETVYGLGADASNESAVIRVYEIKHRPRSHPLIVHIAEKEKIIYWTKKIPDYVFTLIECFWPGPLTLILNKSRKAGNFITGGQETIALRMPQHPVSQNLLLNFQSLGGHGIVGPSANKFGHISPTTAEAVLAELGNSLSVNDLILDGGPCSIGIESTILNCSEEIPILMRPGAITREMLIEKLDKHIDIYDSEGTSKPVRFSGNLKSHYKPNAQVILNEQPVPGAGLIALSKYTTPKGVIRLAAPQDEFEFAKILYHAFRLGDEKKIDKIYVFEPENNGIGIAVRDRLKKASR
jgi:L-threonylcarbamoyladenylate synthase